ncbi:MAG: HpcH/HpaI aldolase/citrate lyase family protein [Vicinamibacteria bacterium]
MEGRRRSILYLPGSSERMLEKAGSRGADVLVLDLEDGVHPDQKPMARELVRSSYPRIDFGDSEVFVRANAMGSPWFDEDLTMLESLRPEGVILPKVEKAEAVEAVARKLAGTPLFLMIETATGILEASSLARLSRVRGLVFGAADYRESLRAGRSPDESELFYARMSILHAARASGIEAYDAPWFEYKDLEGLESSSRRVRLLGFDGKTAIHPSQVPTLNLVFSPTADEIERARAIVEAMTNAFAAGRSVATVGNEMVEALHLAEARRILARAKP